MHTVKRTPPPPTLRRIKATHTQNWINHYKYHKGPKPSDSKWRDYKDELGNCFANLCGYCETLCRGEVDHFKPKSKAPHLVYSWSNWVFSCHDCNHAKGEKWPSNGYFDPCSQETNECAEQYFEFDIVSGEILPKKTLSNSLKATALVMIKDLDLNGFHHLKQRLEHLVLLLGSIDTLAHASPRFIAFRKHACSRKTQLSSFARQVFSSLKNK